MRQLLATSILMVVRTITVYVINVINVIGSTREASRIPDLHEITFRRHGGPGADRNSAEVSPSPARPNTARTGNRREGRTVMTTSYCFAKSILSHVGSARH